MKLKIFITMLIAFNLFNISGTVAKEKEKIGFLTPETSPNSLAILPPPPTEDSVTFLADKAQYETGFVLPDPVRFDQAKRDADYKNFGHVFSEAFGMKISKSNTPVLYNLLAGVLQDSHDYSMRSAKTYYKRVRPFVVYNSPTCTPEQDSRMSATGSYPSGHASFGWATALILAEMNPARQTEILRRGYDFGKSRVVCKAHWQSDVDNGQLMGAAVVAALHGNNKFTSMLNDAKKEFRKLSKQN